MQARIKWVEGRTFVGQSGQRAALVPGGPVEHGGRNLGPSPMELMLIGTGGCTAFDVLDILKKGRQAVMDCSVELEAERAAEPPRVFTTITMRFVVTGRGLRRGAVERAVPAVGGEILLGVDQARQDRRVRPGGRAARG